MDTSKYTNKLTADIINSWYPDVEAGTKGRNLAGVEVLDADGNVDKEASRRVEVKFRLKDDEMIDELSKIMSGNDESSASDTSTDTAADSSTDTAQ